MSLLYAYNTGAANTAQTAPKNDSGKNVTTNYYQVTLGAAINANATADIYIPSSSGKIYEVFNATDPGVANVLSVTLVNGNARVTAGNGGAIALGSVIQFWTIEGSV